MVSGLKRSVTLWPRLGAGFNLSGGLNIDFPLSVLGVLVSSAELGPKRDFTIAGALPSLAVADSKSDFSLAVALNPNRDFALSEDNPLPPEGLEVFVAVDQLKRDFGAVSSPVSALFSFVLKFCWGSLPDEAALGFPFISGA